MSKKRTQTQTPAAKGKWRNRIVRFGMVSVESCLFNDRNWRIHTKDQQAAMRGAFNDIGWIDTITINLRTSEEWPAGERDVETMVDGHMRVLLADQNGESEVPAIFVDLNPHEEAKALLTLDPIGQMAVADRENTRLLLEQTTTGDPALMSLLSDVAARAGVIPPDVQFKEFDERIISDPTPSTAARSAAPGATPATQSAPAAASSAGQHEGESTDGQPPADGGGATEGRPPTPVVCPSCGHGFEA